MIMIGAIGPLKRIADSPRYKWWAFSAISIGLFLTVLDQSGVGIALPRIADHFGADIPTVQWINLSYVLSTSVMLMPLGRLSDIVGRKRIYVTGFVVFVGAAALAGSAQTFLLIIVAKVIQGAGSAAIQANGMAMITEIFPERERGKALGLYMAIIGTGAISGPIAGGVLVSALGWRSVFFASVPVGLAALVAAVIVLKGRTSAQSAESSKARFDWVGAALSSGILISFLLGMTNGYRLGWSSPPIVVGFALAVVLFVLFVWWELRVKDPMLDLSFFSNKVFSMGVTARFLTFLGVTTVFFLMPFYLIQGLGYPANKAGLIMVPGSICSAVMGTVMGRLSDRYGTRWLSAGAMASSAFAMFLFSRLTIDSSPVYIIIALMLSGSGMGAFSSTNTSAIMSSLDRAKYGIASAFINLTRTSANLTGVALATTVIAITMGSMGYEPNLSAVTNAAGDGEGVRTAFVIGLNRTFLIGGSLMVVSLIISVLRGEAAPVQAAAPEDAKQSPPSHASDD